MIQTTGKSSESILLNDNNRILFDQKLVANKFNDFFVNIGSKLSKEIPIQRDSPMLYLTNQVINSFFIQATSKGEIEKSISYLDSRKASDVYQIPIKIVKECAPAISDLLCDIFNCSFQNGVFPAKLKLAYVIPVHKSNSKLSVENYRPISIIPIFGKILEKLMHSRVMAFLNKYDLLFEHQYGFREKRSTDLAILDLHNKIINAFENNKIWMLHIS